MREVAFTIEAAELGIGIEDVVSISVGGVRLPEIVRQPSCRWLRQTRCRIWPGSTRHGRPGRTSCGRAAISWASRLGPATGAPSRSAVSAASPIAGRYRPRSTSGAATVTWRDWRSARREWDLSGLRALVFDRGQYERALQLAGRSRAWQLSSFGDDRNRAAFRMPEPTGPGRERR